MNEQLIQRFKGNIAELIARYEALCQNSDEMAAKISEYEAAITEKDKTITELKERLDNLQLTLAFDGSSPDRAEAKRKVSHLMKEIDKCISLLND